MTKQRGIKIAIICAVVAVVLVGAGFLIYFNFFQKSAYRLVDVELNTYTAKDFTNQSEIEFHDNGTFHVHIEHKTIGLLLTGIGTYTKDGNTYQLTFVQAYGRKTDNTIDDLTDQCNKEITCTRSGNRIKFIYKSQIFYFG